MAAFTEVQGQFQAPTGYNATQDDVTGGIRGYSMEKLGEVESPVLKKAVAFARLALNSDLTAAQKDMIRASVIGQRDAEGLSFAPIGMIAAKLNGSRIDRMVNSVSSRAAFAHVQAMQTGESAEVSDAQKERIAELAVALFEKADELKDTELELPEGTAGATKGLGLNKIAATIILAGLATKDFNPLTDIEAVKALVAKSTGNADTLVAAKQAAYAEVADSNDDDDDASAAEVVASAPITTSPTAGTPASTDTTDSSETVAEQQPGLFGRIVRAFRRGDNN